MTTFLQALLLYGGIAAVATVPIVLVARSKRRAPLARQFIIAAAIVGGLCALLAWTSRVLVDQCIAAGNTACFDYGGKGFQVMLVAIYSIVALSTAISIARD